MKIKFIILSAVLLICLVETSFGQGFEEIKTSKGNLSITKSEDEIFRIKFNGTLLLEEPYVFGRLTEKFPAKIPQLFLISVGEGAIICATQFVIVDISGKIPKITKQFGNCSDAPKVTYKNKILTVKFTSAGKEAFYKTGKAETWQYCDGELRRIL